MDAHKFIATLTVRAIQEKLRFSNIDVSICTIMQKTMQPKKKWLYACEKYV